jgi:hypothetical protein
MQQPDVVNFELTCNKCGKHHKLYARFKNDPKIDKDMKQKGFTSFPKTNKLVCSCKTEHDLSAVRNQMEQQTGRKILFKIA